MIDQVRHCGSPLPVMARRTKNSTTLILYLVYVALPMSMWSMVSVKVCAVGNITKLALLIAILSQLLLLLLLSEMLND
jgi:hypothetical protein